MTKTLLIVVACCISIALSSNCPENIKCPFKNGFCCDDEETCCPHGYKCDVNRKKYCVSADEYIRFPLQRSKVEKVKFKYSYLYRFLKKNEKKNKTALA